MDKPGHHAATIACCEATSGEVALTATGDRRRCEDCPKGPAAAFLAARLSSLAQAAARREGKEARNARSRAWRLARRAQRGD